MWRPSQTVDADGCYTLIGENTLTAVTKGENGLVSMIVPPGDVIAVVPDDVVGIYAQTDGDMDIDSTDTSNQEITLDGSYEDESVWYHVNTEDDPLVHAGPISCPFPVGRNLESFTSAAPILSIDMRK